MLSNPTPLDVAAQVDKILRRNIQWPNRTVTFGTITVTTLDRSVEVNSVGGASTVNLPDATTCAGMFFDIKKTDVSANTVTVQSGTGGQTIDGAATKVLVNQNDFVVVASDGTNYKVFAVNISSSAASGAIFYTASSIVKTNGVASLAPIPGTLINFTVAVDGYCVFMADGIYVVPAPGLGNLREAHLNIQVDGVDYEIGELSSGSGEITFSIGGQIGIFLAAGPHTVQLSSSGSNATLQASASQPLTISAFYPGASSTVAAATPKAATFVVHPTPGIGDYTTIQAALTALTPLGGGYILAREGTYAENLVFPNVPVVLRGVGDNTVINLAAAAAAAFSVSVDQDITIEDMRVLGDATAAQIVLTVPATVTGTKKITLNRVNSYDSVKTIVSNAGVTTPLIELKSSALRGATAGWASAGGGTVILTDLAGNFGAVTGAATGTLITRNALVGAVAISSGGVVESVTYPATTNAQIVANTDNYAIGTGSFFRLTSDAQRNITGIAGGWSGRSLKLANRGSFNLVLVNNSGSSTATNRIKTQTGTDLVLSPDGMVELIYDATDGFWLQVS